MAYTRKTVDVWEVQGNYGYGYGWECVCAEETWRETRDRLREYRENEPQYVFRARKHREPVNAPPSVE